MNRETLLDLAARLRSGDLGPKAVAQQIELLCAPSKSEFTFDRIRQGRVMAEQIRVSAVTLKEATVKAEKLAYPEDDEIRYVAPTVAEKVEHPGSPCPRGRKQELDGICVGCDCGKPTHVASCRFVASMFRQTHPAAADRVMELVEEVEARMRPAARLTFHGSGEDLATDVHALLSPEERKRFAEKWRERDGATLSAIAPTWTEGQICEAIRPAVSRIFDHFDELSRGQALQILVDALRDLDAPVVATDSRVQDK